MSDIALLISKLENGLTDLEACLFAAPMRDEKLLLLLAHQRYRCRRGETCDLEYFRRIIPWIDDYPELKFRLVENEFELQLGSADHEKLLNTFCARYEGLGSRLRPQLRDRIEQWNRKPLWRLDFDVLCDRFRDAYTNEQSPKIEDWLALAPQAAQSELLHELLLIETHHFAKRGLPLDWDGYQLRFPNESELLKQVRKTLADSLPTLVHSPHRGDTSSKAVRAIDLSGSFIVGPYKLLQKLGEGGMGQVWMAEQEKPVRRRVALKLIKAGQDSRQVIARFEAERQALAMMNHENIAKVLDAGADSNGTPYFVMELVHGVPITQYCDQQKLSIKERLELFVPVCKAVQHAHQKGIIHRDLKPSNVLVCQYDGKPLPKVIDFGLAKALEHTLKLTDKTLFTEFGQVVGTIQYMSPEQAEMNQLDIDTRTDIYSLGAVLYELLTGSTPLDRETLTREAILQVLEKIRLQEPPRPSMRLSSSSEEAVRGISRQRRVDPLRLKSLLRGELDWIVMKALEKDRGRRYATAEGFAGDIKNFLCGELVTARPPSASYRLSKYIRRHKGLVVSVTAIGTTLVVSTLLSSWLAITAKRAQIDAERARQLANQKTAEVAAEKDRAQEQRRLAISAEAMARQEASKAKAAKAATQSALDQTEATLARSNYFLALNRWKENRVSEAKKLLLGIPAKHRNFEWFYANNEFYGSDITFPGHTEKITAVAFSRDGTRIISASADRTIRIWNSLYGEEKLAITGHSDPVSCIAISPDGTQIASGDWKGKIKLWDAISGKELRTIDAHTDGITCLAYSPDGSKLASGSNPVSIETDRKNLKVWDTVTGAEQANMAGHRLMVSGVVFSHDSSKVISAGRDKTLRVWESQTGELIQKVNAHKTAISSLAISPAREQIASASETGEIRIWGPDLGTEIVTIDQGASDVSCLTFSPDGTQLLAEATGGAFDLWEVASGRRLKTFVGHLESVTSLAFSPDGARVVSGSNDKTVKLWNATDTPLRNTLRGHQAKVLCVDISPDSSKIISGSEDGTIRIWDAVTRQELKVISEYKSGVEAVTFSPDGRMFAAGGWGKDFKLWSADSGGELRTFSGHTKRVTSLDFSPDGRTMISASRDGTFRVWNVESGAVIDSVQAHQDEFQLDFSEDVMRVAFSPDGSKIISGGWDTTVKIWDAGTLKLIKAVTDGYGKITGVVFNPDGSRFLTSSTEMRMLIRDTNTANVIHEIAGPRGNYATCIAFSPDGSRFVSGHPGRFFSIWDANTAEELRAHEGHAGVVSCIAFSGDGTRVVTGSSDQTLKVWEAPDD